MPDDVDVASLDYTNDPRVFSDPEGNILVPSLRDSNLHRFTSKGALDYWYVEGVNSPDADVTIVNGAGENVLQEFDTMEEALHHVLGEPIEALPDPDDINNEYNLLIDADAADPIWVQFGREAGGWHAHISQPACDGYPAYFGGNTPLEALTRMFGLRPADDDGNYEYTPGG